MPTSRTTRRPVGNKFLTTPLQENKNYRLPTRRKCLFPYRKQTQPKLVRMMEKPAKNEFEIWIWVWRNGGGGVVFRWLLVRFPIALPQIYLNTH